MDRFSIPQSIRAIFDKAIEAKLLDAYDIYALGAKHGGNFDALINEIQDMAYSNIHSIPEVWYAIATVCDNHYACPLRAVNKAAAG